MTRRNTFRKLRTGVMLAIGALWGTCVQVWGAVSRWSWRGYPSEAALRKHLKSSSNHPYISNAEVDRMSFEECIAYHEKDHIRRRDRPRWTTARRVPGTSNSRKVEKKPEPVQAPQTVPQRREIVRPVEPIQIDEVAGVEVEVEYRNR